MSGWQRQENSREEGASAETSRGVQLARGQGSPRGNAEKVEIILLLASIALHSLSNGQAQTFQGSLGKQSLRWIEPAEWAPLHSQPLERCQQILKPLDTPDMKRVASQSSLHVTVFTPGDLLLANSISFVFQDDVIKSVSRRDGAKMTYFLWGIIQSANDQVDSVRENIRVL